jgi:hypothetical protein
MLIDYIPCEDGDFPVMLPGLEIWLARGVVADYVERNDYQARYST